MNNYQVRLEQFHLPEVGHHREAEGGEQADAERHEVLLEYAAATDAEVVAVVLLDLLVADVHGGGDCNKVEKSWINKYEKFEYNKNWLHKESFFYYKNYLQLC